MLLMHMRSMLLCVICLLHVYVSYMFLNVKGGVCVLLPLENLLWAKLRDYAISRVNPNSRYAFFMWVVNM